MSAGKVGAWTEAHRREAYCRTWELAAALARDGRQMEATELLETPWNIAQREATWRADLGCAFDPARIDREVRRVRALAEGRLVRETRERWRIVDTTEGCHVTIWEGDQRPDDGEARDPWIIVKVRVARIRRAP